MGLERFKQREGLIPLRVRSPADVWKRLHNGTNGRLRQKREPYGN